MFSGCLFLMGVGVRILFQFILKLGEWIESLIGNFWGPPNLSSSCDNDYTYVKCLSSKNITFGVYKIADQLLNATSAPSSKSLKYKKERKTISSPIMWHRYAKRTIRWLCPSSSSCKALRGQPQRDRGRTLVTMRTCEEMNRGIYARRASKLGPVER